MEDTPVLAGVCGTDPFRQMDKFLRDVRAIGFAGVQNFPTVGLIDGLFRRDLEETGMGYGLEVEMIAVCLREGWPIRWVPISTIYGDERSHIRPLHHLREFMAVAVRARRIVRGGRG